mgnify:CR=1 FL=1
MTLRDEIYARLDRVDISAEGDVADTVKALLPWLHRKLTERDAATVERCARLHESVNPASDEERLYNFRGAGAMGAVIEYRNGIRALSSDPRAKERWELEAKLEQAKKSREEWDEHFYGYNEQCVEEFSRRLEPASLDPNGLKECLDAAIAELDRQLAALDSKHDDGPPAEMTEGG